MTSGDDDGVLAEMLLPDDVGEGAARGVGYLEINLTQSPRFGKIDSPLDDKIWFLKMGLFGEEELDGEALGGMENFDFLFCSKSNCFYWSWIFQIKGMEEIMV